MLKALVVRKGSHEHEYFDLSDISILFRRNVKEIIKVFFDEILDRVQFADQAVINYYKYERLEKTIFVKYQNGQNTILVICDENIKKYVLEKFLHELNVLPTEKQEIMRIKFFVSNYEIEESKIDKIKNELYDTKVQIFDSINQLIDNNEKLEDILIKSEKISNSSRLLLDRTRKLNGCCKFLKTIF